MKAYPEYKDSGLPWLGRVPAHWEVCRLKRLLHETDRRSSTGEQVLLSMTRRQGLIRHADATDKMHTAATLVGYKICHAGEVVMNRMQAWSGMFHVASQDGLVSPDYSVFSTLGDVNPGFLGHLLRSPRMVEKFHAESKGIGSGFLRLYGDRFGAIHTAIPPRAEQDTIERLIDSTDRRVRRFIRNRRGLIEVLNEQKQAIINRAVTRGLDPNVPLKPSGIDWLGEIPDHWEVLSLKRVLRRLIDCEHKTAPAVDRSAYFVIRTSAVRKCQLRWEGTYCTTPEAFDQWTQRGRPEPADVIFTREAPAGEACIVPEDRAVCLGQRTVLMKPRRDVYDARFLVYMIYGGPPRDRIHLATQGSTVGHFNMDDIGWLPVLKPPLDEQQQIAAAVLEHTHSLDALIRKAEREIALIREYRARLIGDVVTGKVDVRHLAASERVPADEIGQDEDLGEGIDEGEMSGDDEPGLVEETTDD